MQRLVTDPRPGWAAHVAALGLTYNETIDPDGKISKYWQEGSYYTFSMAEQALLEQAAKTIYAMCDEAGDYLIKHPEIMAYMGIPSSAFGLIERFYQDATPNIYGRFDFCFDGNGPPKLLEYNADTPTSLLEAAYLQWDWYEMTSDRTGALLETPQWNDISEMLVRAWNLNLAKYEQDTGRVVKRVHLVHTKGEPSGEDLMNVCYMADKLREASGANFEVVVMPTEEIWLRDEDGRFLDNQGHRIEICFKLYPWEWLLDGRDRFGPAVLKDMQRPYGTGTTWIEPIYKLLWSNKGLLPVLWNMFKDDNDCSKFLLPAFFDDDPEAASLNSYVRKPLLGREGANVTIVENGSQVVSTGGDYSQDRFVVQEFCPLPRFDALESYRHPVLGIWMVHGDPAGLGIRESSGLVTDNTSCFVPHILTN